MIHDTTDTLEHFERCAGKGASLGQANTLRLHLWAWSATGVGDYMEFRRFRAALDYLQLAAAFSPLNVAIAQLHKGAPAPCALAN